MMQSRRVLWFALALAAAACGGAEGAGWAGTVRDSAGIHIVENTAEGVWTAHTAWTVEEELRIGTVAGDPDYQFGQLLPAGSVAVLSDGRIVVFDSQGQHVKVFTPEGVYQRTIGGPGAGPGEIGPARQSSMLVLAGDTIQVNDLGNQRVSLFLPDGTFISSYPLDFALGLTFRWEVTDSGDPVAQVRRVAFPGQPALTDSMDAIVIRHTDGTVGDTLLRVPSGRTFQFTGGAPEVNFFVPEPIWALVGDGVLFGINDAYRLTVYGGDGTIDRIISKPFTPAPITEGEQQILRETFRALLEEQGAPPQTAAALARDRLHFHTHYPAFAQVLEGPDGALFTQLFQPIASLSAEEQASFDIASGSLGSRNWDVFDRDGRYLGVVAMPLRFQPVLFEGDAIYGVQRDELDVSYVARLRLIRPVE